MVNKVNAVELNDMPLKPGIWSQYPNGSKGPQAVLLLSSYLLFCKSKRRDLLWPLDLCCSLQQAQIYLCHSSMKMVWLIMTAPLSLHWLRKYTGKWTMQSTAAQSLHSSPGSAYSSVQAQNRLISQLKLSKIKKFSKHFLA